jgi:cytochrome subunit of sulfide dehydrogenase
VLRFMLAGAVCIALQAHAQDRARQLASACAICHGTDGRGDGKLLAPLAGMPRERIASQMRAFRDGSRPATVMHQLAKGYTDSEIDALAAWFSAQGR